MPVDKLPRGAAFQESMPPDFRIELERTAVALELEPGPVDNRYQLFLDVLEAMPAGDDADEISRLLALSVPYVAYIDEAAIESVHAGYEQPWVTANMGHLEMLRRTAATAFVWAWLRMQ